jgi:hypothetical protein
MELNDKKESERPSRRLINVLEKRVEDKKHIHRPPFMIMRTIG